MAGALAFTLQGCGGGGEGGGGGGSPEFAMDCGGECNVTYSCSGGEASAGCASGSELTSREITPGVSCHVYVHAMKSRYEDADAKKDECDAITAPNEYVMDCGGDCNVTYSCSGGKASAGCASGSKIGMPTVIVGMSCHLYVNYMKSHYEDADTKKNACDTITAPPPTPPPTEYVLDCGGGCTVTFVCGSDLIKQGKVSSGCTRPDLLTFEPERARDEENCDMYPSLMRTMFNINGPGMKESQCGLLQLRPASGSEVAAVIDYSDAVRGSFATRSASVPPFALEKVLYMALGGAVAVALFLLVRAVNAALHKPRQARDAKAADPIELVQVQQPSSATAGVP